jgi:hypothetical protein
VRSSYGRRRDLGEKKLTGGARQSERERGREGLLGVVPGLVRVVAGLVLPGSAQWLALFIFFVLKLFLFSVFSLV